MVKHTEVLIIGAGPSGLMMAAQLLRYGIQPTIIDAKPGPDREKKATLVHARSMELFRQLGLADQLLAAGQSLYAVQFLERMATVGILNFSHAAVKETVFPFIEGVGQDRMERILLNRLTERACPVAWETRLEAIRLDDGGATVSLVQGGEHQDWRCDWVIGADGQHSTLRKQLNIPIEGDGRARNFFAADVETDQTDARKIKLVLHDHGPLTVVPSGVANRYRITGQLPKSDRSLPDNTLRYADLKREVDAAMGVDLAAAQYLRVTQFSYRRMVAEQMNRQRCFLVGDAAHGISPTVSRGMNEGLYDAANLAWKLAGVVNGRMAPRVLLTYQQERMPVIKRGGGVFEVGEKSWIWPSWLERADLSRRISRIDTHPVRLRQAFDRLSGLDVNYRRSPLSIHHASGGRIQAGDRLPCLPVYDEKSKIQTDLHRWCEKPGFVLLLLGTISHHHLNIIGQWMRQKYPREMHLYYLPYSDRNQHVFHAFEMKPTSTKIMLIRPDMHIGYINDMLNVSLIDTYMEEILGWAFFGHLPEKQ